MYISQHKHTAQHVVQCYINKVHDHVPTQRGFRVIWQRTHEGYEVVLKDGDKVCFACYKSHLQILKLSQIYNIDTDLVQLIQVVKSCIIHVMILKL